MKQCWLVDKQRPTMKEIVKVVEGWDTTTWDRDVLTAEDCKMSLFRVCYKQSMIQLLNRLCIVAVAQLLLPFAEVIVNRAATQRASLDHADAVPAHQLVTTGQQDRIAGVGEANGAFASLLSVAVRAIDALRLTSPFHDYSWNVHPIRADVHSTDHRRCFVLQEVNHHDRHELRRLERSFLLTVH